MSKRRILVLLASALGLALPVPSQACSLGPGYLQPSNFDLVCTVQAIVIARATAFVGDMQVAFDVEKVLKGTVAEKSLTFMGNSSWRGASDPASFTYARPGASAGACIAMDYKLKSRFLLFLTEDGKERQVAFIPFARVNEEISGLDAPWTRAVQEYIKISAFPTVEEQKKALRELAQKETDIPGLKADIAAHFLTPSGSKSFEDLKELYDRAKDKRERDQVLWAFAYGKHTPAAGLVRDLLPTGAWKDHLGAISAYAAAVSDPFLFRFLIKAAQEPGSGRLYRHTVASAVAEGADAALREDVLSLLRAGDDEDAQTLSKFFRRNPLPEAVAEIRRRVGGQWFDQAPLTYQLAALGDPEVVAWALKTWNQKGEDRTVSLFVLAISPLPEADAAAQEIIRDHPNLVLSIAQGYGISASPRRIERLEQIFARKPPDPSLREWARQSLQRLAREGDDGARKSLSGLPPP